MNVVLESALMVDVAGRQLYPVILSGGSGTRLWPMSRAQYPKQLLPLLSERSMLQETVIRTGPELGFAQPLVICNEDHRFLIAEQLRQIGVQPRRIVLEPVGRNTAPALAVAALMLTAFDPEAVMLVQPSDHAIGDTQSFREAIATALHAASLGRLVTFGIAPDRPETGYGYIRAGAPLPGVEGASEIDRFVEKPDLATARRYVESGAFFWNSGIFLLPAKLFLEELERLQPEMLHRCVQAVTGGGDDLDFFRLDAAAFGGAPALSIDHAVMEHTRAAAVVPVDMAWSDIGSWRALRDAQPCDMNGNVLQGDVVTDDVSRCYIRADGRLVAALGVEDLVVVASDDAVLVASAERAGEIGRLVETLRRSNRSEPLHHTKVYRPWGFYQTVDAGDRFQVKRIMVKPGAKLSLQMHHHRAEHWVVVCGTASITCGKQVRLLRENESIYIPIGETHRLENPGKVPLHLIEVQSGAYLGEDDIVRFEDTYGRQ